MFDGSRILRVRLRARRVAKSRTSKINSDRESTCTPTGTGLIRAAVRRAGRSVADLIRLLSRASLYICRACCAQRGI